MKVYVFDLLAYSREVFMERRFARYGHIWPKPERPLFEVRNGIKQTFLPRSSSCWLSPGAPKGPRAKPGRHTRPMLRRKPRARQYTAAGTEAAAVAVYVAGEARTVIPLLRPANLLNARVRRRFQGRIG
jgi:hypothetical protein